MWNVLIFKHPGRLFRCTAVAVVVAFTTTVALTPLFGAARLVEARPEEDGFLKMNTSHTGLAVKIDGAFVGYTPLNLLQLDSGPHKIHVAHPDRSNWLDTDWVEQVEIAPNDTLTVNVMFQRSFSINSQPYGAAVYLENEPVGETPVFVRIVEGETKQVTLSKTGYRDSTFTLGGETTQFYDITLQRSSHDFDPQLQGFKQKGKSKTKVHFFTALGLAVASGTLALYFRSKADNKYDRYLETGNPRTFNKFYDDAKKFDKLAAVSFGTFQVSFVVSFYLFLKQANQ
ncbi:MAG: PEGA domain-containing protein [bacterium]